MLFKIEKQKIQITAAQVYFSSPKTLRKCNSVSPISPLSLVNLIFLVRTHNGK